MALVFLDGFDHYTDILDKWDSKGTNDTPSFTTGRFGGLAIRQQFQNGSNNIVKNLGPQTELFVGFALFQPALTAATTSHFRFRNSGGGVIADFKITNAGEIRLEAGGQTATSATGVMTSNVWQFVELHYQPNSTAGTFECRIGEVVQVSITGDTTTGADNDVESISILTSATNAPLFLVDDLYVLNTTGASNTAYLGDTRITTLRPKANGNVNNFTPNGADTGFEACDEIQMDSDTTFVEAGQLGAKEDYNNEDFSDLGIAPGTIFGVQSTNAAKKTDAGTLRYKDQMVIAGTRFDNGTEVTASSGNYKCTTFITDTDPSDSTAWTETKVAAVGSGVEITFREV